MRRFVFPTALTMLFAGASLAFSFACSSPTTSTDDNQIPLPERREVDAEAGASDDVAVVPPVVEEDSGNPQPILDAGVDAGPGCNAALDCERVVFVTKGAFVGSAIGGLAGADAKCQAAANTSTLKRIKGRTFQAWIGTVVIPTSARIPHGTKPFILANGTVVAKNWTDLTDGDLVAGIDRDEANGIVASGSAWTGTTTLGALTTGTATCGSWDTSNADGTRGNVGGAGGGWSSAGVSPCTSQNHLYCFEL